uniref:Putative C2H2 zinc finger protein n=1 Tax=Eutrema halophilum TaxID=98038 RepID=C7SI21_EUTHA|nr:putative C2H2 zinc finger protein [Eutrema halophilum]
MSSSSSYNTSVVPSSSSSAQPFFITGSGAGDNDFDRKDTFMSMIQQPISSAPPAKKRRNQPGNPSKFVCDVCNKGFQREQNLQLHRRGHNLPWKLKQKSTKEVKRKVYLCPEPTCVHHDPSRALGDLTGIKKHYYRKHGEKKWKCDKCSKRYAVQSDWKAHSKTCGTKEYRCDCGTIFSSIYRYPLLSRRDSYITHRAFCDALIQETARNPTVSFTSMTAASSGSGSGGLYGRLGGSSALSHHHPNSGFTPLTGYNLNIASPENSRDFVPQSSNPNFLIQCSSSQGMLTAPHNNDQSFINQHGLIQFDPVDNINLKSSNTNNSFFNLGFFQENTKNSETSLPSLYSTDVLVRHREENMNAGSNVSATALLQKATQMGSMTSNDPSALFRGLASSSNSSSVVVNDFGGGHIMGNDNNGNLQGLMNSLAAVNGGGVGGSGGNIFDVHFGDNGNMSGSDKLTLDFLGVGGMLRNVNRGGSVRGRGRDDVSLDGEVKFPEQNHPFGRS